MTRLLSIVSALSTVVIGGCNEPDVVSILCACSRINFAGMNDNGTMYEIEAEIKLGNVKCKTTAERLKWKPMASVYVRNRTTILGSGAIKCSIRQPDCKKKLSFPDIPRDEDVIVWIQTIIDDFVFCRPVVLPTSASSIERYQKSPYITTTQHTSQNNASPPSQSTLAYTMFSASTLTLAVCVIAVGFLCRRKRQQRRASRSSTHEPSNHRLIESSLELSVAAKRDLLVIAVPESGSRRISNLLSEIQTTRIAILFNPENSEEDIFKNIDQWIDKSIKTCMHQQILIIFTVSLVSEEAGFCSNPFDDVSRTFFQRMMSYLGHEGSDKIFYVFLDPPSEILNHLPPKALVLSHQRTYDLSQDENRYCQTRRLLSDLQ